MVRVGDKIRILKDCAYGTTEKAGTILEVISVVPNKPNGLFYTNTSSGANDWYFHDNCFDDELIELITPKDLDNIELSHSNHIHKWRTYTGLFEKYDYCEVCDVKREQI